MTLLIVDLKYLNLGFDAIAISTFPSPVWYFAKNLLTYESTFLLWKRSNMREKMCFKYA